MSDIYDLLPAHIRTRDLETGGALKALFALAQREGDLVEASIRALSESWFIETCPPWAISYIGQLLAVRPLHDLGPDSGFSPRAWVGNTIRNRQRKGTLGVIESVSSEATGLPARANEIFERLSATQGMNHLRLHRNASARIRDGDRMALAGSAFDQTPRITGVRRTGHGSGSYSIPDIAIHLWRLQPYRLPSVSSAALSDYQFSIDPLGRDLPLFWSGQTEESIDDLAGMLQLPVKLERRPLYRELEAARQAITDGVSFTPSWFGANPVVVLEVQWVLAGPWQSIEPAMIAICDVHDVGGGDWRRPPGDIEYVSSAGATENRSIVVGLDPVRGRVALPEGRSAAAMRTTCIYGSPGDVGGGSYERRYSAEDLLGRSVDFQVGVTTRLPGNGSTLVPTVAEAIALWNARPPGEAGLIVLMDNDRFEEDLTGPDAVLLQEGSALALIAADWPLQAAEGGGTERLAGTFSARDRRAALIGPLHVETQVALGAELPCRFALNGILMQGELSFSGAVGTAFGRIDLAHVSIDPINALTLSDATVEETLSLTRSTCGSLQLGTTETNLNIVQSLVDGRTASAISARAADLCLEGSTLIGATHVGEVQATDSIFDGVLVSERTQTGCLQYCYYQPENSRTPRRYRCQPDLALLDQPLALQDGIIAGLRPQYAAIDFGQPDYGRLADHSSPALSEGAADGGAMGVWGFLGLPWRETNLAIATEEYLPFGLMAGSIYET